MVCVGGQHDVPAAIPPGERYQVLIVEEARWASLSGYGKITPPRGYMWLELCGNLNFGLTVNGTPNGWLQVE